MNNPTVNPAAVAHQREQRLQKASHVRHQRRLLRERIAALAPPDGAALAGRVLLHPPDYTLTMTVTRLLTAINGFGSVRAREIAGTHHTSPLGKLDDHERTAITSACRRRAAHLHGWQGPTQPPKPEQALRALARADQVRLERVRALRTIAQAPTTATGAWRAAALIVQTRRPEELDGLTVTAVLEAIPRVHAGIARQITTSLDLADSTRLGMLSRTRSTSVASTLIRRYSRLEHPSPPADSERPPARGSRPPSLVA
jgi:ribosomal protein S13